MTGVSGYALRGGYGRIRAANFDYDAKPTPKVVAGVHPVIFLHQAGVSYIGQFAQSTTPISSRIMSHLARRGIPSVAGAINGSVGGDGFGNPSTMTDIEAARILAGTLFPTCDNSKVHFIAFSMGAHAALRYAQLNSSKVASITSVVGLADAMQTYDDVPAQQVPMRTAWAAADRAALAASGFNTLSGMSALNGVVPVQMFYSTADTVVLPATQTSVGALLGASLYPVSSTLDHTAAEAIAEKVRDHGSGNWSTIYDFIAANDSAI